MDRRRSKTGSKQTINSGIYVLEILAKENFSVGIKKFADRIFSAGYYYYVGSAQKNLKQRLTRHLSKKKIIHWHIDHITSINTNSIKSIFLSTGSTKNLECELANYFEKKLNLDNSFHRFGNSDSNCSSTHLFYSMKKIDYNHLFSLYQSMVRLIPSDIDTL